MSSLPESIYFLSIEEVKEIHVNQISLYGGSQGIRDEGLLASAIAQPSSTFADQYLHASLLAMAAAYLFHLVTNHPFIDGNKRTGLTTALVFLELNGLQLDSSLDAIRTDGATELESVVVGVATKRLSKEELIKFLEAYTQII